MAIELSALFRFVSRAARLIALSVPEVVQLLIFIAANLSRTLSRRVCCLQHTDARV